MNRTILKRLTELAVLAVLTFLVTGCTPIMAQPDGPTDEPTPGIPVSDLVGTEVGADYFRAPHVIVRSHGPNNSALPGCPVDYSGTGQAEVLIGSATGIVNGIPRRFLCFCDGVKWQPYPPPPAFDPFGDPADDCLMTEADTDGTDVCVLSKNPCEQRIRTWPPEPTPWPLPPVPEPCYEDSDEGCADE